MLEKNPWIKYAPELNVEWKQANDEGKKVDDLKELCGQIAQLAQGDNCEHIAKEIREKLISAPVDPAYPYNEPSDLEGIRAQRPAERCTLPLGLVKNKLRDKIEGAWLGRISGCLLGKPVEGYKREDLETLLRMTNNFPMQRYITENQFSDELRGIMDPGLLKDKFWADCINGVAPEDDDTNYTVLALKLIENYGKEFTPNDVLETWLRWIPMFSTCTAERVAYRNAASGLYAPETASFLNPYREWIGAQIRGDYFGYINPGNPEKAAEMAWRDASISHVKNGIYGEMFVAAMLASAAVCDDVLTVIEAGLAEIPQKCRLRQCVENVRCWYQEGLSAAAVIDKIHQTYNESDAHDWCHTNSNAMIVVMALLYGQKNFEISICLAVQSAFDTDCNGATVGSIIGMLIGKHQIPSYWYEIFNQQLQTSINGYIKVSVEQLVEKTMTTINEAVKI